MTDLGVVNQHPSEGIPHLATLALLDDLVGGSQQRFRDGEAEGLGGLEIDDQFEFCWRLHRQFAWTFTFENPVNIRCGSPKDIQ